jgi:hypothetical protein
MVKLMVKNDNHNGNLTTITIRRADDKHFELQVLKMMMKEELMEEDEEEAEEEKMLIDLLLLLNYALDLVKKEQHKD